MFYMNIQEENPSYDGYMEIFPLFVVWDCGEKSG
jgi:hypothetical protein